MTKLIKHITACCLIVGLYAPFTANDSFAGGACCGACALTAESVTLSTDACGVTATYTFSEKTPNSSDVLTADGVRECTITFPATTDATTATLAGSSWDGNAIGAWSTQTATTLAFIYPSSIGGNTTFPIVIANVTNGDNISTSITAAMDNTGGCTHDGVYLMTTQACETCVDGILNQDEYCIDCGGTCAACGTCTELSAGDIAIIGMNTTDPDEFTFVALTDIADGTTIRFTDKGWKADNTFYSTEGILVWTSGGSVTCGDEVTIEAGWSATSGSVVTDGGTFSLAIAGDQILAYQGSSSNPIFIAALDNSIAVGWDADATTAQESALPSGLTDGTNCIALDPADDNAVYDCSTNSGAAAILAAVNTDANWTHSAATITLPVPCTFTCGAGSETCFDNILNNGEASVDCGGTNCPACECE